MAVDESQHQLTASSRRQQTFRNFHPRKVNATAATMSILRPNTLIIDFRVLPKRPDAAEVEKFFDEQIQLQLSDTANIQLHNVRNCVYIEMVDAETALRYQNLHNNRHTMHCDGKGFKIPVYIEKETVTVRVHDLPPRMPHTTVLDFMQQYGTPISITRERWRHYFAGVYNGVRVLQIKLDRPIPSFVTINGETTLVTYPNQQKTCRFCELAVHPKQKCARPSSNNNPSTSTETGNRSKPGKNDAIATVAASSDPVLATMELNETTIAQQSSSNDNNTEITINDDDGASSDAFTEAVVNQKRRLARLKERTTKKICKQDSPDAGTNITTSNRFEALVELDWVSPSDLGSIANANNSGKEENKNNSNCINIISTRDEPASG